MVEREAVNADEESHAFIGRGESLHRKDTIGPTLSTPEREVTLSDRNALPEKAPGGGEIVDVLAVVVGMAVGHEEVGRLFRGQGPQDALRPGLEPPGAVVEDEKMGTGVHGKAAVAQEGNGHMILLLSSIIQYSSVPVKCTFTREQFFGIIAKK